MDATALGTLISAIEAKLVAAPSLGINIADPLTGITSATKSHQNLRVMRERTSWRGTKNAGKHQQLLYVDDVIVVELWSRIAPKDQRTSRTTAYTLEDAIRNRITDQDYAPTRESYLFHIETLERLHPSQLTAEWLVLTMRFRATRHESVGAG